MRRVYRKISSHLPALQRYARSISADASHGAALVERTVSALRYRDYRALAAREVRVRLFRDFQDNFAGSARNADRHALMLRYAQGFSIQEVAAILRCDVLELQDRLASAYAGLHGQTGSDVLLIEDDPVLASGMTAMIESLGHRVLGVARNEGEALAAAKAIRLDAVVADLHGGDGNSEVTAQMQRLLGKIDAPLIVVTPSIDSSIGMARRQPTYLVATPFQSSELQVVLAQALHNQRPL